MSSYYLRPHSVNTQIITLWEKYASTGVFSENGQPRIPQFYGEMSTGGLLVIGANPSFIAIDKQFKKIAEWCRASGRPEIFGDEIEMDSFYRRDFAPGILSEADMATAIGVQELYRKNYDYFKKFSILQEAWGDETEWKHIDLFQVRLTSLSDLKSRIRTLEKTGSLFVSESILIVRELIQSAQPDVVLVENAFAAEILTARAPDLFPHRDNLDLNIGTPSVYVGNGSSKRRVPIFYTSMITGQRALDLGSFARLQWAIKRARVGTIPESWRPKTSVGVED